MALVNQAQSRQGNANFVLYKLARQHPSTFHDVTNGTISVPCQNGTPNCTVSHAGDRFGILAGYNAKAGYDLATGIGSVDVDSLLSNWSSAQFTATTTTLNLSPTSSLTHGQSVAVTGGVAPTSGSGVPTGDISLITSTGIGVDGFRLSNGAISGNTNLLPGGTYTVTAHYSGDPTFGGSDSSPVSITVGKENSSTQLNLVTFDWNGREISNNASTAVYGSPYIFRVNVLNSAGAACNPNPFGEASCPSGTVNLTDNSSALDGGAFKLNSLGYTEDQQVQFSGGSNAVTASYGGDNSFNASSATTTYSITAAATTISAPVIGFAQAGANLTVTANIQSQSLGAAPTGSILFFANGTPVPGTPTYSSTPGSNGMVTLSAFLDSSSTPFPTAGAYAITATYNGDGNYAASTSAPTSVSVQYPIPDVAVSPFSTTVNAGSSLTLTAIVSGFSKTAPEPSGTVQFLGNSLPLSGTETYQNVTGDNGGPALQASFTFVPQVNENIVATYSGDNNYPATNGLGGNLTVVGSDFSLNPTPPSITVNPGQQQGEMIFVYGQSNYVGTINFSASSCSGLPGESTCSFSPASVSGAGWTEVTITTTAPHTVATKRRAYPEVFVVASLLSPFLGVFLIGAPRRFRLGRRVFVGALLLLSMGCGSGSSGGGGGGGGGGAKTDPGTPAGSYTITVTGTSGSGSTAITHTTTFNLVVQ
jgi:hypothetical protein